MRGRQGRHHDACRHARQALELFTAAGDPAGQADALNETGWRQCRLGGCTAGIASCQQALQPPLDLVPDEVLTGQVKLALEDLYRPASLAQSPLVRLRCVRPGAGAVALRTLLLRLLADLGRTAQPRDREAAALLGSYYVKRVGSHEVIAERLGLPRTTFYRRLSRGLELLARQIRVAEGAAQALTASDGADMPRSGTESGT